MISCILLAAGLSSRFKTPKALALINHIPVITHIQTQLINSQIDEIIVVLGAHMEQIKPFVLNHAKIKSAYNKDYALGQTSSFKTGVAHISRQSQAMMLLPVDFPFIQTKTFNSIINSFLSKAYLITIPTYQGRRGHPPLFSSELKNEILSLPSDMGVNILVHNHDKDIAQITVDDPGIIQSFNTQDEFKQLIKNLPKII